MQYKSDLTNSQWNLIKPHIPHEKDGGRHRTTDIREVINALLYIKLGSFQLQLEKTA